MDTQAICINHLAQLIVQADNDHVEHDAYVDETDEAMKVNRPITIGDQVYVATSEQDNHLCITCSK